MKIERGSDHRIELTLDGEYMSIQAVRDHIIHCVYSHEPIEEVPSLLIDTGKMQQNMQDAAELVLEEGTKDLHISAGTLGMQIARADGQISWMNDRTKRPLLREVKKEFIKVPVIKNR